MRSKPAGGGGARKVKETSAVDASPKAKKIARQSLYLAKLSDGRLFYVDFPKNNPDPAGYRAFLGTPGAMQEVKINDFNRVGTEEIFTTEAGTYYSPPAAILDTTKEVEVATFTLRGGKKLSAVELNLNGPDQPTKDLVKSLKIQP